MPKKYVVFFKSVGRKWFLILVGLILLIFWYNQLAAIILTIITLALFMISYIPGLFFSNKLLRFMKGFFMIEDDTIAEQLKRPIRDIREKMFEISQLQNKKKWLIVFQNKRYIYFHSETIEKFMDLHKKGYSDKEILDSLQENDLRTRAEVKIIRETLIKHERLGERDISVKVRQDQERYK